MLGQPELLEVAADGRCRNPLLVQRSDRRPRSPLRQLASVGAEDQTVVDVLGRRRAERLGEPPVQLFVRPVVVAAQDVRDPEVDVVDNARQVVGGGAVLAQQSDSVEAIAEASTGFRVAPGALALADGAFVPLDAGPGEVGDDRVLAAGHVAFGVGVIDPEQQPVAKSAVGNRTEGVADVQGAGRTRCEADFSHSEPKVTVPGCVSRSSPGSWSTAATSRGAARATPTRSSSPR